MIDLNHSRNFAVRRRTGCFHVPFLLPALLTALGRQLLLLFGCLLLATPVAVQAQFNYTITNGTVTITKYTGAGGSVTIPDTITGLPVTAIGDHAFDVDTNLTSVTIPNSVASIGEFVFDRCISLTNVIIGNNVGSIENYAFAGCASLSSVTIPNSVTSIREGAFSGCTSLGTFNIPNSVTNIGFQALSWCDSLTNVTIPSSVTSIGDNAFGECYNLTTISVETNNPAYSSVGGVLFDRSQTMIIEYPGNLATSYAIPNGVTTIGDLAFFACTSLSSLTIPNSVTYIGSFAFNFCTGLTDITIPDGVTSIGNWAFSFCTGLTNVTIGSSVASIGGGAFRDCTSLTNVTIPRSVTRLDSDFPSFQGCSNLARVYFQGNAPNASLFYGVNTRATAYYLPGTTGWDSTSGGIPTAFWTLPYPLILNDSVGVRSNQFGFTVSWATNLSVVVEAATDLGNPVWTRLATNALSGGTFHFTDPQWTKYPTRIYRVRSQKKVNFQAGSASGSVHGTGRPVRSESCHGRLLFHPLLCQQPSCGWPAQEEMNGQAQKPL